MATPWLTCARAQGMRTCGLEEGYDLFRVTTNLILFRETGVLDRELNLASIPYMGSPEGLRHFCPPDHTSHSVEGVMISK